MTEISYHRRTHGCNSDSSENPRCEPTIATIGQDKIHKSRSSDTTINEAQHPHRKPNKERKARRYGSRSGPKGSKLFFEKMQQLLRTRTKAIPNTIVLYRPNFWSYISI